MSHSRVVPLCALLLLAACSRDPASPGAALLADDLGQTRQAATDVPQSTARMLLDANPGTGNDYAFKPELLTTVGDWVYFRALHPSVGCELWRTDGDVVELVLDLVPGEQPTSCVTSTLNDFVAFGSKLFFTAQGSTNVNDGDARKPGEPWVTDGTPEGTFLLKDINPGFSGSGVTAPTALGNLVVFGADDGVRGREPWVTDGTPEGTRLLKDLTTIASNSGLATTVRFGVLNGKAYFAASTTGGSNPKMYVTDGTPAGTQLFHAGTGTFEPTGFAEMNGWLYFVAHTGGPAEIWRTDGTTVEQVTNIRPSGGRAISADASAFLTPVGSTLFFLASDGSAGGDRLWRTNGTPFAEEMVPLSGGATGGVTLVKALAAVGSRAVFIASVGGSTNFEPWSATATGEATEMTLLAGTTGSIANSASAWVLGVAGGHAYFAARSSSTTSHPNYSTELYRTDGVTAELVKDLDPSSLNSSTPANFAALGNQLLFTAHASSASLSALWKSDGTSAGTTVVRGSFKKPNDATIGEVAAFAGSVVFTAGTSATNQELYRATAGALQLLDQTPTAGQYTRAFGYTEIDGALFFFCSTGSSSNFELCRMKADGTVQAFDVNGTSNSSLLSTTLPPSTSAPPPIVQLGNRAFWVAKNAANNASHWYSIGANDTAYTQATGGINLSTSTTAVDKNSFTFIDGTLYFGCTSGSLGMELCRLKPDGRLDTWEINAGTGSSDPRDFTKVGDIIYFTATNGITTGRNGRELWMLLPDDTVEVVDVFPGTASSSPTNLTVAHGTLYFTNGTSSSSFGTELWRIDEAGNPVVIDIAAGSASSTPLNLTMAGGKLYFTAVGGTGRELWMADPSTPLGARLVREIGTASSNGVNSMAANFTVVGDTLYFTAATTGSSPCSYQEIWRTDPVQGAVRLTNLNSISCPGSLREFNGKLTFLATRVSDDTLGLYVIDGSTPVRLYDLRDTSASARYDDKFIVNGDKLYFVAFDPTHGWELRITDGTPAGTRLVKDINPGFGSALPQSPAFEPPLALPDGRLAFLATDGTHGLEVWISDGTEEGTFLAFDVAPGTLPSSPVAPVPTPPKPSNFVYVPADEPMLFFLANDGSLGPTGTGAEPYLGTIPGAPPPEPSLPPVADAQSVTTAQDTAVQITLTASNPKSRPLTFAVTQPAHGTVTLSGATATYTPAAGYSGPDSFTFTASDGIDTSAPATVSITVTPVTPPNSAPVVPATRSETMEEDTFLDLELTATDADGDPVTFSITGGTAQSFLTHRGGAQYRFTPPANAFGTYSFTYTASDGQATSNTGTFTILVTPVNDAPTASNGSATTLEDTPVSITLVVHDIDSSTFTARATSGPSHGTVTFAGLVATYTPSAEWSGTDSFTFVANDGQLDSNEATITITVTPVNDAPIAESATVTTPMNTPVAITLVAGDVEGDPLSYGIVGEPLMGTLNCNGPQCIYTPNGGFFGNDVFQFIANDGQLDSNVATVTIHVVETRPGNVAPVALDLRVWVPVGGHRDLWLNAIDANDDALTFEIATQPEWGTLTDLVGNHVRYTPNASFDGTDTFAFRVSDGELYSAPGRVTITVGECRSDAALCVMPVERRRACFVVADDARFRREVAQSFQVANSGRPGRVRVWTSELEAVLGAGGRVGMEIRTTDTLGNVRLDEASIFAQSWIDLPALPAGSDEVVEFVLTSAAGPSGVMQAGQTYAFVIRTDGGSAVTLPCSEVDVTPIGRAFTRQRRISSNDTWPETAFVGDKRDLLFSLTLNDGLVSDQ